MPGLNLFIKFVVDVETGRMAVGGELHSDTEFLLLVNGAEQSNIWGVNFKFCKKWGG